MKFKSRKSKLNKSRKSKLNKSRKSKLNKSRKSKLNKFSGFKRLNGGRSPANHVSDGLALITAIRASEDEIAMEMIENISVPELNNQEDLYGFSPLMWASRRGNYTICKALIENGANINIRSKLNKSTALFYAIEGAHSDVAIMLIESGAKLNIQNQTGNTALLEAIDYASADEIVMALLNHGADVNIHGHAAVLVKAITRDYNDEIIFNIINKSADINYHVQGESSPLIEATRMNKSNIVDFLIEKGARTH
jgi:ankyrin repeat protein